jgi:phosphatidylglycerophosphatase A
VRPLAEHKNKARAPLRPLNVATLALSVGGLGFLRPAPGTWGSLPPVVVLAVLVAAGTDATWLHVAGAVMLLASSVACVAWGGYAEDRFGRKDAAEVVADETAGVCLPAIAAVAVFAETSERLFALAAAFVLFRLFDIVKPWPGRRLERLPRGWGVLFDDLAAGVYAMIVIVVGAWIMRGLG